MKSSAMKILIVGLTALCLSAGVVAGMLVSRLPATNTPDNSASPHSPAMMTPLVDELHLRTDQQDKMRLIWEGVRTQVQQSYEDAKNLEKGRDDEIAKMLTDEQKAKFEKISQKYHDQFQQISRKRDQTIGNGIAQTNGLLDADQKAKYAQILHSRFGDHVPTGVPTP